MTEVNVYTLDGKYQNTFESVQDCAAYFKVSPQAVYYGLPNNYLKGFIVKKNEGDYSDIEPSKRCRYAFKSVYTVRDKEFNTLKEVSEFTGLPIQRVWYRIHKNTKVFPKVSKEVKKVISNLKEWKG
jgi:hypothetical protein